MKILLDMNIPLSWKHFLLSAGYEAIHWRDVGDIRAADSEIMAYARSNYLVVFTHDLDFGAILAATNASGHRSLSDLGRIYCAGGNEVHISLIFRCLAQYAPQDRENLSSHSHLARYDPLGPTGSLA